MGAAFLLGLYSRVPRPAAVGRKTGRPGTAEILSVKTVGSAGNIRAVWAPDEDLTTTWIAVAAALVSMLSGRIVRPETTAIGGLASTGELIAVSGFKDKVAAAKRGRAMRIVAPAGNEQGSQQMAERQRAGLEFVFVATADEAIRATLAKHPMKGFTPPG
ncbi:MAG: S16 family serine protease [Streptosporangiaceae bacterium]